MDYRHTISADYSQDDWTVGAKEVEYFGDVSYPSDGNDVLAAAGALDAVSYLDVSGSYTVSEMISLSAGLRLTGPRKRQWLAVAPTLIMRTLTARTIFLVVMSMLT